VGGGIEHIRHKRREKKMERKFASERKEQKKQVENLRWDQVREAEAAKIREAAAEKYRSIERTASIARPEVNRRLQTETAVEQNRRGDSEMAKQLEAERKETQRVLTKAEQIEQERQREQLELAEGHRMERSAWHNIEVDSHGKAVQETSFEYGHEYYKERARETAPKTQQAKQHIDGAAGEVALVAAALSDGYAAGQGQTSSHSGAVGTAAHTAQPQAAAASIPQANARQSIVKAVTTPPTTPGGTAAWFVALVVILAVVFFVAL
jgi:hypothetical protein